MPANRVAAGHLGGHDRPPPERAEECLPKEHSRERASENRDTIQRIEVRTKAKAPAMGLTSFPLDGCPISSD